jgi:hypothetical protein
LLADREWFPTRKVKIRYLLRRRGITTSELTDVEEDIANVLTLFWTFNDGAHGHAGRFIIAELSAIRTRVGVSNRLHPSADRSAGQLIHRAFRMAWKL